MATSYPGGLDSFTNPTATDSLNSATVPHATQHANANDAIEAIQAELGTDPAGASLTVKARFEAIEANGWVTSTRILDGTIVDGDINAAAAIDPAKINGTAVVDSDARLSDARTPTAHAASHESGGGDEITIAQSQVTDLTSDLAGKAATVALWLSTANTDTVSFSRPLMSGTLQFRWHIKAENLASNPYLADIEAGSANVRLLASGKVRFYRGSLVDSTNAVPNIDSTGAWVEVQYVTSTGAVTHRYSADGVTWTDNGTGTTSTTGDLSAGTSTIHNLPTAMQGLLRQVTYIDDGTTVASLDCRANVGPRYRDPQGNTWTFGGTAYAWRFES